MYRFKGFTEKANNALNLAIESAQELGHTYIGTEHVVLGLLREGTGVAASVLGARGITAAGYRDKVVEAESSGEFCRLTPEDFTPRAKKAMEMAMADSVTVSMAAESRGLRRGMEGVSQVVMSTASGVTSD